MRQLAMGRMGVGDLLNRAILPNEIGQLLSEQASSLELYASQWTVAFEDCVQEAFIELAAQPSRPANPVAWLYRVVRNKALNASRSARRRANHERLAAMFVQPSVGSQKDVDDVEQLTQLAAKLESLPADRRESIVLRIWSGLTWQEIAELTGTSSSSAQRKYVAALKELKELLEPSCPKNLNFRQT